MAGLYIIGAGGLGREVLQYALQMAAIGEGPEVRGFIDDDADALNGVATAFEIVAPTTAEEFLSDTVVVALGEPGLRQQLRTSVQAAGGTLHSVIHPQAWVSPDAHVGEGCIVAPHAFVGAGAHLGANVVVNTMVSVGHDSRVGTDSVLSPHVGISGQCHLGDRVLCGTHATVIPGRTVGTGARLAAGAVVTRDVPGNALAAGNPATSRVLFRD